MIGIDEAGRGCVIGDLKLVAVVSSHEDLTFFEKILSLYNLSLKDSKLLKPEQRRKIELLYEEHVSHVINAFSEYIEPREIDKKEQNLNELEYDRIVKLIKKTIAYDRSPFAPSSYYIDWIGSEKKFVEYLDKHFEYSTEITFKRGYFSFRVIFEKQADKKYKIVSLASILAKVYRDYELRVLESEYDLEPGILASGYPNRSLIPFLKKYKEQIRNREFPFIRYSWKWKPLQQILNGEA